MKKDLHALVKGSLVLLVMFNLFNLLNFAFQFFVARVLTVSEYGILATLFAISFILSLFSESIQVIVTGFVSRTPSLSRIHGFLNSSLRKYSLTALAVFVIYALVSLILSPALGISIWLFLLNGLTIFTVFLTPVTQGVMQGRKQFYALGGNVVIAAAVKLVLAVMFIFLGWRIGGAVMATILGGFMAFLVSFLHLKDIYCVKSVKVDNPVLGKHSRSIFFLLAAVLVFYSLDIIIAKLVFDPVNAGYYALASVLAKTIFLGTQPISKAMFPFSSQAPDRKKADEIFNRTFVILVACALVALIIFYFFPDFLLLIFTGKSIVQSSSILFYVGIATTLISFANLVFLHNISIGNMKGIFVYLACIAIEMILLYVFSESLFSFSFAFILASAIFLFAALQVQAWKN